ncbi:MAG TPA: hypothetical protein DDW20_04550 [Firmicutes bacterium]|nr:hypothetical protein [Bacillota bacterium]
MKMKKSIKVLMILSIIFAILGLAVTMATTLITSLLGQGVNFVVLMSTCLQDFPKMFDFTNSTIVLPKLIGVITLAVFVLIGIVWIIVPSVKKQKENIASSIVGFLMLALIYFVAMIYFFSVDGIDASFDLAGKTYFEYILNNDYISKVPLIFIGMVLSLSLCAFALCISLLEFIFVLAQPKYVKQELSEGDSKDDVYSNEEITSNEELAKILSSASNEDNNVVKEEKPVPSSLAGLSSEDLRAIIRDEIQKAKLCNEEEVRRIVREELEKGYSPKEIIAENANDNVENVDADEEVSTNDKPKIIRIPFETRIKTMDPEMRNNFNELKAEIMSYGVKSRVSNSGDTFRLHTKTYVKMTIAGKSLKLYFALDPKDYENTTLPIADVSHKGIYKEIPLVFKVKSGLSLRRAKALIADAMAKDNLVQKDIVKRDYIQDIIDSSSK